MSNESIFLIEDEKEYRDLYKHVLSTEFNCYSFEKGLDALEQFNEIKPRTIILDLNLPDISGIEFCKKLYSSYCTNNHVDVIFVSGETNPEIKLNAFEVGAADYLTKPFELKELLFKVRSSVSRTIREESLQQDVSTNRQLVYTSMEQASQYSTVMNFFKTLNTCRSIEQVASAFFTTMSLFSLNCSLRTKAPTIQHFRPDGMEISPIESDVYTLLENKGRIFEFSNRLIINDEHVSFIIKNPPKDEHSLGQVRDYVASIVEGLEAKVMDLYSQAVMNESIADLANNITELKTGINEHNQLINAVMSNMISEIAGSFHSLDMSEPQEVFLNQLIEKSTDKLSSAEVQLVNVMNGLEHIKRNMETVQKSTVIDDEEQDIDGSDVELF